MVSAHADRLLGIDWGTTNRRAYLIDRAGQVLQMHADGEGLLAVKGGFAASLAALRATLGAADVPVLMSGMVGSAGGWQEVPYLDINVSLTDLPEHVVAVPGATRVAIVPGYRLRGAAVDVMRGEEMQLLGAAAMGVRDGTLILPGTHSKWVDVHHAANQAAIVRFATYMTGELFAMLGRDGTLAALLAPAPHDDAAFIAGLDAAQLARPLSAALFGARAHVVTGAMTAAQARSYVSGLLIGAEFAGEAGGADPAHRDRTVHLVGSAALAERYAQAARHVGLHPVLLDPDAVYAAALRRFFDKI